MKAPSTSRRIPTMESGRMVCSTNEGGGRLSISGLPDREQVQTGREDDQSCDNGAGAAVVLEPEGNPGVASCTTKYRQHAEYDACHTQQRENGKKRPHVVPQSKA